MKEINRQRQAIRDYRRMKEIYTQFKESGWSAKFYQEHRAEIEAHKKAQAVYELHDGKLPTLKELTAESGITTKYLSGTFRKQINITAKEIV